jgi:predicted amidophosphoribosyltransferase
MSFLDLICPTRCAGCGQPGALACRRCRQPLLAPPYRHEPTPCPPGLPPLWVAATYDGSTRELLLGFKERAAVGLAGVLGDSLAAAVSAALAPDGGPVVLVPVPSQPASVRHRGDDVVGLMTCRAARRLRRRGVEARVVSALRHRRVVADSAGLGAIQRAANLRGAFALRPGMAGALRSCPIVLADDLVTTGATLSEAAIELSSAQLEVTAAATVAATRLGREIGLPG